MQPKEQHLTSTQELQPQPNLQQTNHSKSKSSGKTKVHEISIPYKPRPLQKEVHKSLKRFNVLVCHRRFGKSVLAINELILHAVQNPNHKLAYIAPTYRQGKAIAWDYLKQYTKPLMYLGGDKNETELRVDLWNGSKIQIYGADNNDSLRGLGFHGVIMDEYAIMAPRTWTEIVRPAISDTLGWVIFIGTPMGHNQFWEVYDYALRDNKDWFGQMYRASETKVIPDEELKQAASIMTEEQYNQEFECSFTAAVSGSYYGKLMTKADNENRIGVVPLDENVGVETWWDLGIGDSTAIWFAQRVGEEVHLIDYYENSGESLMHYADILEDKGYAYSRHIAPHDIQARELGTGKSRLEVSQELGIMFEVAPKLEVDHGIESVRNALPYCWFDREKCKLGIDALRQYRKQWDEKNQVFKSKPLHDWCSHSSDAFRYGCVHDPIDVSDWTSPINVDTKYIV
jgi:phage terminase large subunit